MPSSEDTHGFTVRPDGKPLRTKVVATIGDPERYHDGIVDLDGREIDAGQLDVRWLVDGFRSHGADVIRLNLSHIPAPEQARQVLRSIKAAILESERRDPQLKKIAILADLPGPKIRFDIDPGLRLQVGDALTIAFDRERSSGDEQAVFVDDSPLMTAMHRIDDIRDKLGSYSPEADAEEPDDEQLEIAANILGYPVATARARRRLFDSLMDKITRRLDAGDKVLVFIGEAEAVLEVDGGAFDPREPLLPCRVSTVRKPEIKGRKGFTIKGIDIDIPTFTKQDQVLLDALLREDYLAAGESEPVVAFIGLSFAQTADDVLRARQFIEERLIRRLDMSPEEARLKAPLIIAKIETNRGWENRRYILDAADGVMVARGDLGLQVDVEKVPDIQKRLITLCNKRGKPVITATQMLTSMTASIEPTRAEVSDVFNAIQDGTDAVMLSEETAVGRFPFHALRKMTDIAKRAESYFELDGIADESLRIERRRKRIMDFLKDDHLRIARDRERLQASLAYVGKGWGQLRRDKEKQLRRLEWRRLYLEKLDRIQEQLATNRITEATCTMAEVKVVSAVVAATTSGRTVRMISRLRSRVATIGAAHDPLNARKLAVSYGVVPICVGDVAGEQRFDHLFSLCEDRILGHDYLKKILAGATVIFIGGLPLQTSGATNMLQIRRISAPADPPRPRPA